MFSFLLNFWLFFSLMFFYLVSVNPGEEEITSLGEGAKKDILRIIEAVLEKEKEKKKND